MSAHVRRAQWSGMGFVAPFLAVYLFILIYPLLGGIWLSFQRVDLFGGGTFVGLANYTRLFADPIFVSSLINTLAGRRSSA